MATCERQPSFSMDEVPARRIIMTSPVTHRRSTTSAHNESLPSIKSSNLESYSVMTDTSIDILQQHRDHDDQQNDLSKQKIMDFCRKHRIMIIYTTMWILFVLLLTYLSFFAARVHSDAVDLTTPEFLGCRSWAFNDDCGLWGINCRPFESNWTAIRCPARCTMDQSESVSVFGSGPYRADSRICRAAVHAGVIGTDGGCALMRSSGEQLDFIGSERNGVVTRDARSWFPKSFEFQAVSASYCSDLSWYILAVGIFVFFGYSFVPTADVKAQFFLLIAWGFLYARIIGQPTQSDYDELVTESFAQLIVFVAVGFVMYLLAPARTFRSYARWTRKRRVLQWGVGYVVPFHVLLHMNFFAYLPYLNIDLGGYESGHANHWSYVFFSGIALLGLVVAVIVLRQLYRERPWKTYLLAYLAVMTAVLLSYASFPSFDLHLHHTILGALLLPLTPFDSMVASCAQAAALGCFVQGYAVWGWTSYLSQKRTYTVSLVTHFMLAAVAMRLRIERPKDPPRILNVTAHSVNVTWDRLDEVDGYSVRLNKVEVYRDTENFTVIEHLHANVTYNVSVAAIAAWGTDGRTSPDANFTTL